MHIRDAPAVERDRAAMCRRRSPREAADVLIELDHLRTQPGVPCCGGLDDQGAATAGRRRPARVDSDGKAFKAMSEVTDLPNAHLTMNRGTDLLAPPFG